MKDMKGFVPAPGHMNFFTKKLFAHAGEIIDGSIVYVEKDGGGPSEFHTHEHNHLFIVVKGEVKICLNNEKVIVHENESYPVKGSVPHSLWNNRSETAIVVALSVK
ncbi:MAG: cupin domain-containing protein [Dysgonamonadaceae bacterium]|jgi:quercetin dioxygenase-like cupin family protein|nr:cupin domain-containing protein [Dysgonamonadaceae bacterium]